ncbi:type I methionyl aminopeptidase [Nocardioides caldifontis]|uniref:type I methionyl aminopeptidase n=1 Tax=Nocardioides caldifontis TaxID=2588938 RepID=UPI0011E06828|nr:type I methionyl aminopeptidase [Nocardioides caldifontis]
MFRDRGVEYKTPEQIELMRAAGLVVGRTLELLRATVRPGLTTAELDRVAEDHIRSSGATPSFLGYGEPPFPATICVSVNDEIVHGIPGSRVLAEGDLVSIDCGAIVEGWHGDAAVTVPVGEVTPEASKLLRVTEEALWKGLAAARPGGRLGDVSASVEEHVRGQGPFGLVEEYTGHGIGTAMHQPPDVPNLGRRGRGLRITPGLVIAVEPMVTAGSPRNHLLDDEWTVATDDGRLAAHFEHTVAVTERGPWVLTALDGGEALLGPGWGGPPRPDAV